MAAIRSRFASTALTGTPHDRGHGPLPLPSRGLERGCEEAASQGHSAVVGSMIVVTADTRLAGNPPMRACSRIISSFGAM